jgi:exopolysaccharide biosynthesis polyprenyl glycosylphosphotransferase
MIIERSSGIQVIYSLADLIILQISFWVWFLIIKFGYNPNGFEAPTYLVYSLVAGFLSFFGGFFYQKILDNMFGSGRNWLAALRKSMVVLVGLLLFLAAAKDKHISRVFLFSWILFMYFVFFISDVFIPLVLSKYFFQGDRAIRMVVFGSEYCIHNLKSWLEKQNKLGVKVVGTVLCGQTVEPPDGSKDQICLADLNSAIVKHNANQVVVVGFPFHRGCFAEISRVCGRHGVRLLYHYDFGAVFSAKVSVTGVSNHVFVSLLKEPLEVPVNRLMKRLIDVAVSLPVVLLLLPVSTVIVWLAQRFQSPGPVFFVQQRAGINNNFFKILKYRSMDVNYGDQTIQAKIGDSRIFKFGHYMRKYSVDELPQFINVLFGQMSVVGPRPHLVKHNRDWEHLYEKYNLRSFAKPGITGLAQVRGFRGEAKLENDIRARVISDIEYIEKWSILFDIKIILMTCKQIVCPPKSAY